VTGPLLLRADLMTPSGILHTAQGAALSVASVIPPPAPPIALRRHRLVGVARRWRRPSGIEPDCGSTRSVVTA